MTEFFNTLINNFESEFRTVFGFVAILSLEIDHVDIPCNDRKGEISIILNIGLDKMPVHSVNMVSKKFPMVKM